MTTGTARTRTLLMWIVLLLGAAPSPAVVCVKLPEQREIVPSYAQELLEERLTILADEEVVFKPPAAAAGIIRLSLDPSLGDRLGSEGYRIETARNGVVITAAGGNGILYGTCRFLEWVMAHTTPGLIDRQNVDIDFPVERGQAAAFLTALPTTVIQEKPYYPLRGAELTNLALGVADLITTAKDVEKYNLYSQLAGGYPQSAAVWRKWCDWLARHRMNFITNWPYSAGTNWWELADDPATAGMTVYDRDEIVRAAQLREGLLAYARSRGLKPLLMNYVPGAPTPAIANKYPDVVAASERPGHPGSFSLASPRTTELFVAQTRAILRTYPSLAGLHLRWWGESFLGSKNTRRLRDDLTMAMMEVARESRPDCALLLSGYLRMGGTKAFASQSPPDTIIQSKWGLDWEPVPDPAVPFDTIGEIDRPFLISQNLPSEEFHPIGGVQYRSLHRGIVKYANASARAPNVAGFPIVVGEKDHEWITEINYLTMARLNWDPPGTDVDALVRNYLSTHYGPAAVDPVFRALELTQDVMEQYVVDFGGVSRYSDCARLHGLFGFEHVDSLSPREAREGLATMSRYAATMAEALELVEKAHHEVERPGRESFSDLLTQTDWFAEFMRSRKLMAQAFLHKKTGDVEAMEGELRRLRHSDGRLIELASSKPNISDDFEMEGMATAANLLAACRREIEEIDHLLDPANLERVRRTREVFGQPSLLEVRGEAGATFTVRFALPEIRSDLKEARLTFTARDLDGERIGEEATVSFLGREIGLAPTGDGLSRAFSLDLEPRAMGLGRLEVHFTLAGRPHGTAGYDIRGPKLVLVVE